MTHIFRTKYVALVAALTVGVIDVYADNCAQAPICCETNNECCCDPNFWATGDFLYLRACEDGFGCGFGTTAITTSVLPGTVLVPGKILTSISEQDKDLHFDWDPGFRVGVGYDFSSCWDTGVYWMHIHEKGHGHDGANRAKWKLRFNEVDAVLGYNLKYDRCVCFNLKPFLGVRYARINQTFSTHLESIVTVAATPIIPATSSTVISTKRDHQHLWGVGPLLGLEGDFDIGCGFSVYGYVDGTLLYGEEKAKFHDSDIFTAAISDCVASSESCSVLTGIDYGFGARYEFCLVTIQLGWEHHDYFDYNKIGCGGDLNLYGMNASVGVHF